MNALPCYASRAAAEYAHIQGLATQHQEQVDRIATEMVVTYTNDLQIVSECTGDVLFYNPEFPGHHPQAVAILSLIRDGSDDAELGRLLRESTLSVIRSKADQDAEDFIAERKDEEAIGRWEAIS